MANVQADFLPSAIHFHTPTSFARENLATAKSPGWQNSMLLSILNNDVHSSDMHSMKE
jgi:hypothetical protein